MNLPKEKSTTYITFNTIGCNIFAFFGLITGTWVSGLTGDTTIPMLGMDVYSVQFTTLMRGVFLLILGLFLVTKWRLFTREEDIREVEHNDELMKRKRARDIEYLREVIRDAARRRHIHK